MYITRHKSIEIIKDIKATKETTSESENKINTLKTEINHKNSLVEIA